MLLYRICISLHLLAAFLWLGHMFVWPLIVGPSMKRIEPEETAMMLRERSLVFGGFGWPALAVLLATGLYMLHFLGITPNDLLSGRAFENSGGWVLAAKLALVAWMVVYQSAFGHRRAPVAIYVNILAAIGIVGLSVLFARG